MTFHTVKVGSRIEIELGTQLLESNKVGIQPTTANFISTRFRNISLAKTSQQRADNHHRSTQTSSTFPIIIALQIIEIYLAGFEGIGIFCQMSHYDPHLLQQLDQLQYIDNGRHIMHRHPLRSQQCSTKDL